MTQTTSQELEQAALRLAQNSDFDLLLTALEESATKAWAATGISDQSERERLYLQHLACAQLRQWVKNYADAENRRS